jgi:hypothetical protein
MTGLVMVCVAALAAPDALDDLVGFESPMGTDGPQADRAPRPGRPARSLAGQTLPAWSPAPATPEAILARFAHEPGVRTVQRWAADHAEVSPAHVARTLRAGQRFAALPTVWVRYRVTADWDQDYTYVPEDGLADRRDEPVFHVADQAGTARETQLMVQARWDLGDLVLSPERLRLLDHATDQVALRDEVLAEVNRLYFERRRLQVTRLLAPKVDPVARLDDELRLRELTAHLDALTGARFSAALRSAEPASPTPSPPLSTGSLAADTLAGGSP